MLRSFYIIIFCFSYCLIEAADWIPSADSISIIAEEIKRGEVDLAISYLPKVITYMEEKNDNFIEESYVQCSVDLATAYLMKGDMQSSDKVLENVLFGMEIRNIKKVYPEIEYIIGTKECQIGNFDRAVEHFLLAKEKVKESNDLRSYLNLLSNIISCYNSLNDEENAKSCIEEALEIIEKDDNDCPSLTKIIVLSNSGVFFAEHGKVQKGLKLIQKAYNIAKEDSSCIGFYNRLAINLGIYHLNIEDYDKAKYYLESAKNERLNYRENLELLNALLCLNYYVGNERETSKLAIEYSDTIREQIKKRFQHYSLLTLDNDWNKYCTQLKINMGVLHKYKNGPQINSMCYDNTLFIKNLPYKLKSNYRDFIKNNPECSAIYERIKELRQKLLFLGADDNRVIEYRDSIAYLDEMILKRQNHKTDSLEKSISWRDIKMGLSNEECAIEIISSVGFSNSKESPNLKIGALIIFNDSNAPIYIELCDNDSIHKEILNAYSNGEYGINELYSFNSNFTLYNLLWRNIEPLVRNKKTIYISPILCTQLINWGFIPCPDGNYLNERYNIKHLSTTATLLNREKLIKETAAVFGDMDYDFIDINVHNSEYYRLVYHYEQTRGNFRNLCYSREETDTINNLLNKYGIKVAVFANKSATEKNFRQMDGQSPSIIHIASHAYYLVGFEEFNDYFNKLTPLIARDEFMIRAGVLFNNANSTLNKDEELFGINDGVMSAEEVSTMDLSNTSLVVLSACESLIGNSDEGLGGLPKAFKLAGAQSILGSLWKVSDQVTTMLMKEFYRNLSKGITTNRALYDAQNKIKRICPDPYYWAGFVLLD